VVAFTSMVHAPYRALKLHTLMSMELFFWSVDSAYHIIGIDGGMAL